MEVNILEQGHKPETLDGLLFSALRIALVFWLISFKNFYLFIFGCVGSLLLHSGLSLAVASRGPPSSCSMRASHWGGLPGCRAWAPGRAGFSSRTCGLSSFWARGLQRADSAAVAHGLSSPEATWFPFSCPNQGPSPCPLHWQAGS